MNNYIEIKSDEIKAKACRLLGQNGANLPKFVVCEAVIEMTGFRHFSDSASCAKCDRGQVETLCRGQLRTLIEAEGYDVAEIARIGHRLFGKEGARELLTRATIRNDVAWEELEATAKELQLE